MPAALLILLAYLLGSIPFGYLLVLAFKKQDVRTTGSGNIGATNVARSGGAKLGIATLVLDAAKGYLAVWIAIHATAPLSNLAVAAAVAAVLGHVFPVWLRFQGGKGIATALGVFLALVPAVALGSVVIFLALALTTRYVSLASIAAAASIPFLTLWLIHPHSAALLAGLSLISIVAIVKHHANISRLMSGTENKFGSRNKPTPTGARA